LSEIALVFAAELGRKVRSRLFWIATMGGMLAIAVLIEAPVFFTSISQSSSNDVLLAGPPSLVARARAMLERRRDYRVVGTVAHLPDHVTLAYLRTHGHAGAAIAISERGRRLHLDIYPRDLSAFDGAQFRDLVPLNIELATGASVARVERASSIDRAIHPIDEKFADARTAALAHGLAFGLVFILYLAIIIASQSVMSAVAEEKTSRIAEILVATIAPANLLCGKVFAAAAVSVVQVGAWLATVAALAPFAANSPVFASTAIKPGTAGPESFGIDPALAAAFAAFFLLGFLQYATIYAAAASLVSRTEDLGIVTAPVIMPVVGAFFVAQYALVEPNGPISVACSFVPFLSPFVMFTRMAITVVPWWQPPVALVIDALAVAVSFWAAGRVYQVGMLLYGRLPTARQILAALRA
jgi:ABC-2 type transport system permease protein